MCVSVSEWEHFFHFITFTLLLSHFVALGLSHRQCANIFKWKGKKINSVLCARIIQNSYAAYLIGNSGGKNGHTHGQWSNRWCICVVDNRNEPVAKTQEFVRFGRSESEWTHMHNKTDLRKKGKLKTINLHNIARSPVRLFRSFSHSSAHLSSIYR